MCLIVCSRVVDLDDPSVLIPAAPFLKCKHNLMSDTQQHNKLNVEVLLNQYN